MQVIFGFGQNHIDRGNKWAEKIALAVVDRMGEVLEAKDSYAACKLVQGMLSEEIDKLPKHYFNGKEYSVGFVKFPNIQGEKGDYLIASGFDYSHYRNDHPFSPDGFACMTQQFVLVIAAHGKRFEDDEPKTEWFLHEGNFSEKK